MMRLVLPAAFLAVFASIVSADTFDLRLGDASVGRLTVGSDSLTATITGSPLALANGTFEATAKPARMASGNIVLQYLSYSSAKDRRISVLLDDGIVVETRVNPGDDRTKLSEPSAVTTRVTHPISALTNLIDAAGCPKAMQFYDGRRVVALTPTDVTQGRNVLTCSMRYQVTAGPGHLSPLYISRASLTAVYDMSGTQMLTEIQVQSGPFTLYLSR